MAGRPREDAEACLPLPSVPATSRLAGLGAESAPAPGAESAPAPGAESAAPEVGLVLGPDATLLTRSFVKADIGELRHVVCRCAIAAGLTGRPLDDFVLAINELVTNAVRHGGGTGTLWLWRAGGALVCEVSDRGTGIAPRVAGEHRRPSPDVVGGWGLWLARELSDTMTVVTGESGTAVRISAALPVHGHLPNRNAGTTGAAERRDHQ